jgi:hypothetical protein
MKHNKRKVSKKDFPGIKRVTNDVDRRVWLYKEKEYSSLQELANAEVIEAKALTKEKE